MSHTFAAVVTQPTTLCNLDCVYCYLPDRKRQRLMTTDVAVRIAESIGEQDVAHPVSVVWHGGEPLATPIEHFRSLLAPFESLRQTGRARHHVQTNATLITPAWADLLREYRFVVGIRLDGPAAQNRHRIDRGGRPTFHRVARGVDLLHRPGIRFSVICVVSPETIGMADELLSYFTELGCKQVGFNMEELEGVQTWRAPIDVEDAYRFWRTVLERQAAGTAPRVRELQRLAGYLADRGHGGSGVSLVDPIPTVGHNGDTVLLSPELLGIRDPRYVDFHAGNVLRESLPTMLARAHELRYVREFEQGLAACASSCTFFDYCQGAQAGNRYFERGTFAAAETNFCRTTRQALIRAAAAAGAGSTPTTGKVTTSPAPPSPMAD